MFKHKSKIKIVLFISIVVLCRFISLLLPYKIVDYVDVSPSEVYEMGYSLFRSQDGLYYRYGPLIYHIDNTGVRNIECIVFKNLLGFAINDEGKFFLNSNNELSITEEGENGYSIPNVKHFSIYNGQLILHKERSDGEDVLLCTDSGEIITTLYSAEASLDYTSFGKDRLLIRENDRYYQIDLRNNALEEIVLSIDDEYKYLIENGNFLSNGKNIVFYEEIFSPTESIVYNIETNTTTVLIREPSVQMRIVVSINEDYIIYSTIDTDGLFPTGKGEKDGMWKYCFETEKSVKIGDFFVPELIINSEDAVFPLFDYLAHISLT